MIKVLQCIMENIFGVPQRPTGLATDLFLFQGMFYSFMLT